MFCNIRKMDMSRSFNFSSVSNLILVFIYVILFGSSYLDIIRLSSCSEDLINVVKCIDKEREALVALKQGLIDPSGRLDSWVGEDCCKWSGIRCNNISGGHVIELNLRNPFPSSIYGSSLIAQGDTTAYERSCLSGEINSSLVKLKYLNYLDLSLNDFKGIQIPKFFGMLENLRYLNLSSASFSGDIPPHLGNLSSLNFLDLYMDFGMSELRTENLNWLSSLSSLKHLNLGQVKLNSVGADWLQAVNMLPLLMELHLPWCDLEIFTDSLPSVNFTSLQVIDLSHNSLNSSMPWWVFNLTSLKKLDLSYNSIHGHITDEIGSLVSLEELDLSWNNHNGQLPRSMANLCKLKLLGLGANNFSGDTDEFFASFSSCPSYSLVSLDISSNMLQGNLPESLGRLENLRYLRLSSNSFWGSIPSSVGNLLSLQELDLSFNQMNGTIPESFGQLSELIHLNLISNNWTGVITEAQLMNLGKLEDIILNSYRNMSFVFNVSYEWVPPFRLRSLYIQDCQVGPKFPVWLQVQSELTDVNLRNVGISDTIPEEWFSKLSSQITYLDLSRNQITGKLPHQLVSPKLQVIDLSYNRFEGTLPLWFTNVTRLYLQHNLFSGNIPTNIGQLLPEVNYLYLSENRLNGSIPSSIAKLKNLQVLSLRINQLSGELPVDWSEMQSLWVFDVANNNLSGKIPTSMGSLSSLQILSLSDNGLDGEVPSTLQNCSGLVSIDLGENKFSGKLPLWLGENITLLWMLRLRSNMFNGNIPQRFCNLSNMHILDLAHNNFSGVIPECLGNLTTLVYGNSSSMYYLFSHFHQYYYVEQAIVVAKGRELEYDNTLKYVNSIDFSRNNLTGSIPELITSLSALGTLNLSMNHLTGKIPGSIGNLRLLETLDLSNNLLSGPIPGSVSSLTFLTHLNLSNNNLAGRIPSGNQLQTINDSSIYEGNPLLCGVPLPVKCTGDDINDGQTSNEGDKDDHNDKNDSEMLWFYVSMGPGFVVGFWGVCGTLLVKKTWRYAYFQFFDRVGDRIALMIALKAAYLQQRMGMKQH